LDSFKPLILYDFQKIQTISIFAHAKNQLLLQLFLNVLFGQKRSFRNFLKILTSCLTELFKLASNLKLGHN